MAPDRDGQRTARTWVLEGVTSAGFPKVRGPAYRLKPGERITVVEASPGDGPTGEQIEAGVAAIRELQDTRLRVTLTEMMCRTITRAVLRAAGSPTGEER